MLGVSEFPAACVQHNVGIAGVRSSETAGQNALSGATL